MPLYLLYLGISEHSLLGIRALSIAVKYDLVYRCGREAQLLGHKAVLVLFWLTEVEACNRTRRTVYRILWAELLPTF